MNLREAAQMALQALQESKPIDINDPTAFYRSAHAIEALRVALAQPEPEPVTKMREMLDVQGRDGTWNYDPYFHGMYNGMEFMLAMVESREPVFRSSPVKWLGYTAPPQREWQGLTDEEIESLWDNTLSEDVGITALRKSARAIEAKLKEKNS